MKNRTINTKFWTDPYIQTLSVDEKFIYLYLLTNPHTEISGVYELTPDTISFETKLPIDRLLQSLSRLEQDGKIARIDNYFIIKNFLKHQKPNPSIIQGVKRAISELDEKIRAKISEIIPDWGQTVPDWGQGGTPQPQPQPKPKEGNSSNQPEDDNSRLFDYYHSLVENKLGIQPSWGRKDFGRLTELLEKMPAQTIAQQLQWWFSTENTENLKFKGFDFCTIFSTHSTNQFKLFLTQNKL